MAGASVTGLVLATQANVERWRITPGPYLERCCRKPYTAPGHAAFLHATASVTSLAIAWLSGCSTLRPSPLTTGFSLSFQTNSSRFTSGEDPYSMIFWKYPNIIAQTFQIMKKKNQNTNDLI